MFDLWKKTPACMSDFIHPYDLYADETACDPSMPQNYDIEDMYLVPQNDGKNTQDDFATAIRPTKRQKSLVEDIYDEDHYTLARLPSSESIDDVQTHNQDLEKVDEQDKEKENSIQRIKSSWKPCSTAETYKIHVF